MEKINNEILSMDFSAIEHRILAHVSAATWREDKKHWTSVGKASPETLAYFAKLGIEIVPSFNQRYKGVFDLGTWPREQYCTIPPKGWWCSRTAGHHGPCAARRQSIWRRLLDTIKNLVK